MSAKAHAGAEQRIQTFDEARERRVQDGTEYRVGAITKFLFKHWEGDRLRYQRVGEVQRNSRMDTMDCASRAPNEVIEEDLTHALRSNLLSAETVKFLEPCIEIGPDGEKYVVLSDAYTAIKSGTLKTGNSLKEPCQALHAYGFVPRKWLPLEDWMEWEDYHNPARITQKMEDYAAESKLRLPIYYQQVKSQQFSDSLLESSLSVAGHAWPFDENGIYPRTENPINHAFKLFQNKYFAKDSYPDLFDGDWVKQLAPDYIFFEWGYEIGITEQNIGPFPADRRDRIILGFLAQLRSIANAFANWLKIENPAPAPTQTPTPQPPASPKPKDYIAAFAEAIQQFEGWAAPGQKDRTGKVWPNGTASWRRNNPGNIKGRDGKFIQYKTYEEGFTALKDYIVRACTGKHSAYKPTMTIRQFFGVYAPDGETIESAYASFVCKHISARINEQVYPSRQIKTLI